jgi:glycerophosphoryl diester phosphodiesterase
MSAPPSIDWSKHVADIVDSLIAALLFVALRVGDSVRRFFVMFGHSILALIGRKRYILIWNDVDPGYSAKIIDVMNQRFPHCRLKALRKVGDIQDFYLGPLVVSALVLIDTDVTKFSADVKTSKRIERRLIRYLMRGGGIVGAHDVIYSRVRNEQLQVAFGGVVTDFSRTSQPVEYLRTSEGKTHPISSGLPDRFMLDDREVIWGDWEKDCTVHYTSTLEPKTPLLVSRSYWNGRLVWLNSGDKGKTLAGSIGEPQELFVQMVENAVKWVSRLHEGAQQQTRQIVAHRGASANAHENTISAFQLAITSGAEYAELDVRRTKDAVLVVHHDSQIAGNAIDGSTFRLLEVAAQESGYTLARLEDVLGVCRGKIKLDIELKEDGYENEVMSLVRSQFEDQDLVITSFSDLCLQRIKQISPVTRCGLLLGRDKPKNVLVTRWRELFPARRLAKIGANFVAPHHRLLRFGFSKRMRSAGIPIWVWTVNDPGLIRTILADASVEAVITDVPELALAQRAEVSKNR